MNRFSFLAGAAALIGAVVAGAAPTTAPSPPPAAIVTGSPATYSSVLVLPFAPAASASDWIGKGIQEDLATELVRQSRLEVLTPPDVQAVSDAATAFRIGRDRGASLVAFGTYQILDPDVRINGQLIDVSSGQAIAALKATGPRRDLFHMQDLLAAQAVASLPPASIKLIGGAYASNNESTAAASPPGNNATGPYNSQGYYVTPGPDYVPTYDNSAESAPAASYDNGYSTYTQAYPYDYPWYAYDYPFWGDGFFIGGFGDHRHDRDHGRGANGTESYQSGAFTGAGVRLQTFNSSAGNGFHSAGGSGGGEFGGGFHGGSGGHR